MTLRTYLTLDVGIQIVGLLVIAGIAIYYRVKA